MLSPATLGCLLLLGALCVDVAWGGSSFLSPEHQKAQQRKEPKKPPGKPQPRALEGRLRPGDPGPAEGAEGAEDELELRGKAGATPQGRPRACRPGAGQFSAPFAVGLKLSGAQQRQRGQALGRLLRDVLWEEADDSPAE